MKTIGIYPNGINNTVVQSGWGRDLKVKRQFCYGDGFPHYNIDGRFYWYYDQEQVYHIEDSKTRKIVYIAIARNPQEVIDEFLQAKNGYAIHITKLEIFDKPKELKEFYVYSHSVAGVGLDGKDKTFEILKPLTKAPQSYCFIRDVL